MPTVRCVLGPRREGLDAPLGFVLADVRLGGNPAPNHEDPLVVHWPLESLDDEPRSELWLTADEPRVEATSDGVIATAGEVMFGQLVASRQTSGDLETATRELYARLFHLLDLHERPHLLRLWVAIPRINEREDGLERYRAFCRGRAEAFERHFGPAFEGALSASTAVGSRGGIPTINFLASSRPGRHFENPRQMSAYRYPREYGPRSPSFARATALPSELGGSLFVAGTSSIVGHVSRHRGDFRRQLREALRNIDLLFGAEARRLGGRRSIEPTCVRVYIRNPEDLGDAIEYVGAWFLDAESTCYLRADICRTELLVEVEAIGETIIMESTS